MAAQAQKRGKFFEDVRVMMIADLSWLKACYYNPYLGINSFYGLAEAPLTLSRLQPGL